MPVYSSLEQTTKPTLKVTLDQSPGDRHEIGLFTEWGSECIANGVNCDLVIAQADAMLDYPWCDRVPMQKRYYAGGEYSLSFEHTPNVFFLPYVMTGDVKYVRPMECQWKIYTEWRQSNPDKALPWLYGRDMAWQLRNLAELAYIQKQGDTSFNRDYVAVLELTRQKILEDMADPDLGKWHALGWKFNRDTSCGSEKAAGCYWNGWFEAFLGQVVNHTVQLGFAEWLPVAEWQFQNLVNRCGGKWALKDCANDYVSILRTGDWDTTPAWKESRRATMDAYPADKMTPTYTNGQWISYTDRIESARGWAAIAAQNGITGARELEQKLSQAIEDTGSTKKYFKFNFE